MQFPSSASPVGLLVRGNGLLVVCCGFYLAWWLLAFRPVNPVGGMRSGWLLLPAFAAGIGSVVLISRGIFASPLSPIFLSGKWILWGGIAAYILLLAATLLLLHRPVTTELFLIVGWTMLMLAELNALLANGLLDHGSCMVLSLIITAAAAASLVCYLLYYHLDGWAGCCDGAIPLVLAALVSAALGAAAI